MQTVFINQFPSPLPGIYTDAPGDFYYQIYLHHGKGNSKDCRLKKL